MALLVKSAVQKEDAHYYGKDGTPCHGTLREARKRGAYPSVSTALQALARPGLDYYKTQQLALAAVTYNFPADVTAEDKCRLIIEDSRKEVEAAAERGTYLHTLSHAAALGLKPEELRPQFARHYESFKFWAKSIHKVHKAEDVVVNHEEGYAGRVDLIATIGDENENEVEVIDFKSRKFKKVGTFADGNPGVCTIGDPHKVDSYDTDILQLSAYAFAAFDEPIAARSVYIDPATGAIHDHIWSKEDVADAFEVFKNVMAIWRWQKKYDPREVSV